MNKKSLVIVCLALVLVLSLSVFVSAGFFSNFWGKITGKVTYDSEGWTEWLDRDGPGGSGDYETKADFVGLCDTPTNIECRVKSTHISYDETGQVVTATPSVGCYCLNSNNPEGCLDYEVRFLCPNIASTGPVCGDGTCDSDETCSNCPGDCGVCGTSATCESGVYSYPQDLDTPSNNILHYTSWGNNYIYAEGYCSIVHNCAGYKDVTTAVDGSYVCRCDTGSFGCEGGSCTTSGSRSFVTITSVTCVECDEDSDCGEGYICQNHVCVRGAGPVCGNGVVETGEECDDGNIVSGDGCSSTCTIETVATPACIDSDVTSGYSDGKNYYLKGWYSGYGDFCSLNPGEENTLLEYYCSYDASGNPIKNYTKYNCSSEGKICDRNQTSSTYGACVGDDSLTPRVAFWPGKVNQHFNVTKGVWMSDSDKISSEGIDKLTYCKKQYGSDIVFVKEYKLETITTWMAIGNKGGPYTSTKQSYECVQSSSLALKENGEACSSDFECKSGSCGEVLATSRRNPESVCHENSSKCVIDSSGIEMSEGGKSCLTSKVFKTCSADNQEISWGAQTQCAPDESCFEGRGCLKHEFIFRLNDCHFPAHRYFVNEGGVGDPPELEDAMELSDSCVGVSFRVNKMPPEESDLDDYVSEMEARGYYYYITAAASDFRTWAGFPTTGAESPFILDVPKLCGYLKNEHAEGLYLHEMGRYVAGAYHDKEYDWVHIEQVLACAKANKKKIIWSDFGNGGWTDIRYYIDHDNEARRIFETYGDILVPLIADNTRTDEEWRSNLPGGLNFEDIIHVSDVYCNGKRGGSIQDWHWEGITGSLDVPASDIERYIGISYDEGGKYSQFEDSNWDKDEPQNHGEFYMGIQRGKNYICGAPLCVSSDCDVGYTCESAKCIGSYDMKLNRYGDFYNWDANKYYGFSCMFCSHAGNKGYAVHDLAWYEHTCVENRFLWCWGARWSRGKTYVANAYRAVSCEGLSEPDCNSHSECSWGSFSCVKP